MEDLSVIAASTTPPLDLKALSRAYNYHPGAVEVSKPLDVDWDKVISESVTEIREGIIDHNILTSPVGAGDKPFFYIDILSKTIETPQGPLSLRGHITKGNLRKNGGALLSLALQIYLGDDCIGNFLYHHDDDVWSLDQRLVNPSFRGQRLANRLNALAETTIGCIANKTGRDQEIQSATGKLHVLNFFLKNGYELNPEDLDNYNMIQNQDPRLVIISEPVEGGVVRPWFVFLRDVYEREGVHVWEDPYVRKALQMRVSKSFPSHNVSSSRTAVGEDAMKVLQHVAE